VAVDEDLSRSVAEAAGAELDYVAHLYEHSVEVVLPWLQTVLGKGWKLVAVAMLDQEPEVARRLAEAIHGVVGQLGKKVLVVASANLSSYLGYEEAIRKDRLILDKLVSWKPGAVYDSVVENQIPTCSAGVLEFFAAYSRLAGARVEVLSYATSGDIGGEKELVTGYAAAVAVFEQGGGEDGGGNGVSEKV
jgi:AmmeMemoRadiSam system protein B